MTRLQKLLAWIGTRIGKPPDWERVVRYLALPTHVTGHGDVVLARDGLLFRRSLALRLGWHVGFIGAYERELREIVNAVLRPGDVAIDVGANSGWHTLLMARAVGAAGRVVAVEANPAVMRALEANLALNRIGSVTLAAHAAGAYEGEVAFNAAAAEDATSGDRHVLSTDARQDGAIRVRALDDMARELRLDRVDFVKIDVEGFELPVLQGAAATITRFRPQIVFELNAEYASRGGGVRESLERFFRERDYDVFAIGRAHVELRGAAWPSCSDIWAVPR